MNLIQEAHEFLTGWCQIQLVLPAVLRVNVADNMMKFFQLARVAGNAGFVQGVVFGDVLLPGWWRIYSTIRCIVPVYP